MSDLQAHLERPVSSFPKWGGAHITWSDVQFLDYNVLKTEAPAKRPRAGRSILWPTTTQFFSRHLKAGCDWINLNAYGVLEEIAVVERLVYSRTRKTEPAANLSGPLITDQQPQWDLRGHLDILEE